MGIKDVFNQVPSPQKEAFYKQVLEEVESGQMRKGIYAKALADSSGDGGKAQSLYIKYRVQSLVDEYKQIKAGKLAVEHTHEDGTTHSHVLGDRPHVHEPDTHWDKYNEWYIVFLGIPAFILIIYLWLDPSSPFN